MPYSVKRNNKKCGCFVKWKTLTLVQRTFLKSQNVFWLEIMFVFRREMMLFSAGKWCNFVTRNDVFWRGMMLLSDQKWCFLKFWSGVILLSDQKCFLNENDVAFWPEIMFSEGEWCCFLKGNDVFSPEIMLVSNR